MFKRIPFIIAISAGLFTLIGLLAGATTAVSLLLNWAGFLAALALLLGIINLFLVHSHRAVTEGNVYSLVLLLSMIFVLALGFVDDIGGVTLQNVFDGVQRPLEAALAALLAFFLIFALFRMIRRQWNGWTGLFVLTVIIVLLTNALMVFRYVPDSVIEIASPVRRVIDGLLVSSGMRGLLIGFALGTVMLSLRVLVGLERPYNK
jgi:hypothetical protein